MSFVHVPWMISLVLLVALLSVPAAALTPDGDNDGRARRFVEHYNATVRPLEVEAARAFWDANVTGKEEDFRKKQEAEEKLELRLSDPAQFAELNAIKQGGVSDPLLAREVTVLYLEYLAKQVDPNLLKEMLAKSNAVERAFNVFRPEVDGKKLTDNDVRRILRESRDSAERRAAWEAGKKVGPVVVGDLMQLVALRNEAARKLGFPNYHVLQLYCSEQSPQQLLALFDRLDELTRGPFHEAKAEMDAALARSYGISPSELRPWHYHDPFFQEVPAVLGELPESVYKPLDPAKVCRAFYDGIGLPVDDVLKRSDLYEKPGKNPHAFSLDIDRRGDIRVLENIVPGREWLGTTLHELGHAVYSKNVPRGLPYVLHTDAHPLCTEGVAMMFERFAQNVDWLRAFGAEVSDPERFRIAAAKLRRNRLLVFSRYCQVMFRFEMQLYGDPRQDLDRLWWDLAEKYQELRRPEGRHEPDFASKYHLIGAPVYYHNYLLGEMFASQVHHALVRTVLPGVPPAGAIYVGNPAAGEFMKWHVFQPGLSLNWNDLTRHATGAPLNPKALAEDLKIAD
jgi:peptidyl-dipeptidase A